MHLERWGTAKIYQKICTPPVPRNKLPPLDDVGAQFVFELAPFQSMSTSSSPRVT